MSTSTSPSTEPTRQVIVVLVDSGHTDLDFVITTLNYTQAMDFNLTSVRASDMEKMSTREVKERLEYKGDEADIQAIEHFLPTLRSLHAKIPPIERTNALLYAALRGLEKHGTGHRQPTLVDKTKESLAELLRNRDENSVFMKMMGFPPNTLPTHQRRKHRKREGGLLHRVQKKPFIPGVGDEAGVRGVEDTAWQELIDALNADEVDQSGTSPDSSTGLRGSGAPEPRGRELFGEIMEEGEEDEDEDLLGEGTMFGGSDGGLEESVGDEGEGGERGEDGETTGGGLIGEGSRT
ncbi:MAG: hypothetical protein WCP55_20640 [Lentisphaerota bacterium]